MEIIIKSKNIDFDENILNHVSNLICSFCYQLNFSFDNILQIIFAEEKDYGKEIKKIDPNDNYTNTSTHRGFGKAIYLKDIDKSIIIMRIEILQGIIQIIKSNICDNKLPNLKMDNTQFFIVFAILHEIGHCITHSKNKSSIVPIGNKLLKIHEIPKYYFSIIINEYFASRNVISFIKKEWVINQLENSHLPEFIALSKNMLAFCDIDFVQNIWFFFKIFMDIGVFLIDYEYTDYSNILSLLDLPFNIKELIETFRIFKQEKISENELYNSLLNIVNNVLVTNYK